MRVRRLLPLRSFLLFVVLLPVAAKSTPIDTLGAPGRSWEFSVAGYGYAFPADDNVFLAVARADYGSMHLEARYNYEDLKTVSVFAGWTFSAGEAFTIDLTPMAGVAFGRTTGFIPAAEMSLGYGSFDFYAEGEYLFDVHDRSANFAYSWLELGFTPGESVRAGLTAQRTRIFQSPLEVDRGLFVQLMPGPGVVSLYAFNLFTDSWFLVIGLEIAW